MEGCFSAQDTDAIIRVNVVNFCTFQMDPIFSRLWWMNMDQWITISKASEGARRWEFHNSNSVQRINCFCTYFRLCPTPTKTWPLLRSGWGRGRRRRSWLKLRTGTRKSSSGTCMQTRSFSGTYIGQKLLETNVGFSCQNVPQIIRSLQCAGRYFTDRTRQSSSKIYPRKASYFWLKDQNSGETKNRFMWLWERNITRSKDWKR